MTTHNVNKSLIEKLDAERLKTNGNEPYAVVREAAFLDAIEIIRNHTAAPDVALQVAVDALSDIKGCNHSGASLTAEHALEEIERLMVDLCLS